MKRLASVSILMVLFIVVLLFPDSGAHLGSMAANSPIIFTTNGATFEPHLVVMGNPKILWTWDDGSTSNSAIPVKNYGSEAVHNCSLVVTPWSAVQRINVGYDKSDGGGAFETWPNQHVTAVQGLGVLAPFLQQWCSAYNGISRLNFNNFTKLTNIEVFSSCGRGGALKDILAGNSSVVRLVVEGNSLTDLDLSGCYNLNELRASSNQITNINFGSTGAKFWHLCIHDNPLAMAIPISRFIKLQECLISNTNQSGAFMAPSTGMTLVSISENAYTSANFTNAFSGGNIAGELDCHNNNLISLTLTGCPGLIKLNAKNNPLPVAQVDAVFATLDSLGRKNGSIVINNTNAPSIAGRSHASNLINKGWSIKLDGVTPMTISTESLSSGMKGKTYNQALFVKNGTAPYTWSVLSGSFPTGLFLNSKGVISGTPSAVGLYRLTARVSDNAGATSDRQFIIQVGPAWL